MNTQGNSPKVINNVTSPIFTVSGLVVEISPTGRSILVEEYGEPNTSGVHRVSTADVTYTNKPWRIRIYAGPAQVVTQAWTQLKVKEYYIFSIAPRVEVNSSNVLQING